MSYTGGMRPNGSPQELERRRESALALLRRGLLPHQVARHLGVDRRSVRRWRSAIRKHGARALRAKPAPGRPWKLAASARERLRKLLLKGASSCGFGTDLWTCPRVATVVHREFGVSYHRTQVARILHTLGLTPQKPARVPLERDPRQVRGWMRRTWTDAKKNSTA